MHAPMRPRPLCISTHVALRAALLALALLPVPASAAEPPVTHVKAGAWQATTFRDPANPGCSIGGPGSMPGSRLIMGANRRRPNPMSLIIRKPGWAIPDGTQVQVQAAFPDGATRRFTGRGNGAVVEINLDASQVPDWVHALTASPAMQLTFGGTEPPWVFDLTGTTAVINAMGDCFRGLGIAGVAPPFSLAFAEAPTQPYAAGPGTQPYAAPPPTQPYAGAQPFAAAPPALPGDGDGTGIKKRFGPAPADPAAEADGPAASGPFVKTSPNAEPAAEAPFRPAPPSAPRPAARATDAMPEDEAALLAAIEAARRQYRAAANDMARGAARPTRAQDICQAVPSPAVSGWVGTVATLDTNGEGKGVIAIQLAPGVVVKTWNNKVSDYGDGTLIDPASPLFRAASALRVGERVRFSASLIQDRTDCFREASLTLAGSIDAPEFIMRLEAIQAVP